MPQILVSPNKDCRWYPNISAITSACEELRVTAPVLIKRNGRHGSTRGTHRFYGLRHQVMVKSYLSPAAASETLWHELMHASQAERSGTMAAWQARCSSERKQFGYWDMPVEVEARACSAAHATVSLMNRPDGLPPLKPVLTPREAAARSYDDEAILSGELVIGATFGPTGPSKMSTWNQAYYAGRNRARAFQRNHPDIRLTIKPINTDGSRDRQNGLWAWTIQIKES